MPSSLQSLRRGRHLIARIALLVWAAASLSLVLSFTAQAQDVSLLKDVNDGSANGSPSGFVEVDVAGTPVSLFAATDGEAGREL